MIPREEYERRWIKRFRERMECSEDFAQSIWAMTVYEDHITNFASDPEGSADEEISFWFP
jgi:hypothetical protein